MKTFYLAAIGQLVKSEGLRESEAIIEALFIISQSESDGNLPDGTISKCSIARECLTSKITGKFIIFY